MTVAKTTAFEELYLEFDDGTGSNFVHYAGMTVKGLKLSTSLATAEVPDADDESLPAVTLNGVKAVAEELSGTLTFIAGDYAYYRAWLQAGDARKVRVTITKTQAQGGGHWITYYVLSAFDVTVNMGEESATATVTLTSSGALGTFTKSDETHHGVRELPGATG